MKKKYLLLVIVCLLLTGCNNKKLNAENPTVISQTVGENETNFYGDYQITACRGTAAVYAMSQEEIDAVIGSDLSYQPTFFNTMAADYQEETYPIDRLYEDFRVKPSDLGITKKEVTAVSVLSEGDFVGGYFYILDKNTLLVYYEGVFFEAKKT